MSSARQIPLPLERPKGPSEFLRGEANAEALRLIEAWPHWPTPALALVGPPGAGKTAMGAAWAHRARASRAEGPELNEAALGALVEAPALFIDRADETSDWETLLHLYNLTAAEGRGLLIAGRIGPGRWAVGREDLASRLATIPRARIHEPDEALAEALIARHFANRAMALPEEVAHFIAPRIERSYAAIARAADVLEQAVVTEKRRPTVAFAREVLKSTGLIA